MCSVLNPKPYNHKHRAPCESPSVPVVQGVQGVREPMRGWAGHGSVPVVQGVQRVGGAWHGGGRGVGQMGIYQPRYTRRVSCAVVCQ